MSARSDWWTSPCVVCGKPKGDGEYRSTWGRTRPDGPFEASCSHTPALLQETDD